MLTIGQLSTATGVPTSTIRFWERKGLLRPARREQGQRRYSEDDLSAIGMVLVCQEAGFTLAEIGQMQRERAAKPTG
jgi:DNA-binding transcriptional MerR regulator